MQIFHPTLVLATKYFVAKTLSNIDINQVRNMQVLQTQAFHMGRLANLQAEAMNLETTDLHQTCPPPVFCSALADSWKHGCSAATLERSSALSKQTLQSLNLRHRGLVVFG